MSQTAIWIAILVFIVLSVLFNIMMKRQQRNREELYVENNNNNPQGALAFRPRRRGPGEREEVPIVSPMMILSKKQRSKMNKKKASSLGARHSFSYKSRSEGRKSMHSEPIQMRRNHNDNDDEFEDPDSIPSAFDNIRRIHEEEEDDEELPPVYNSVRV